MSTYCRLCLIQYKVNAKGKVTDAPLKLFKKRENGLSHADRLQSIGIFLKECDRQSSTVCKKCERSIKVCKYIKLYYKI